MLCHLYDVLMQMELREIMKLMHHLTYKTICMHFYAHVSLLHLGWDNLRYMYRLGPAGKDMGVLMDKKKWT